MFQSKVWQAFVSSLGSRHTSSLPSLFPYKQQGDKHQALLAMPSAAAEFPLTLWTARCSIISANNNCSSKTKHIAYPKEQVPVTAAGSLVRASVSPRAGGRALSILPRQGRMGVRGKVKVLLCYFSLNRSLM